eukprot:CAMPEP_0201521746 /NCGR_PEP_ID=MMETSP0161_2-20130828/15995_1 /ASSEMBLY_ACC=CAM_ASM_000251 /TAXON_ID=180227 /ORGANISM="Neoparamoeba aestuarina, Strain SoJaBio B1-5/56/2" /LENGTH=330 /DNA_ID=CAMNT_0047920443 /DNA_START=66 /DNA_END=1055 /DNA_ORIENTATION=+
MALTLKAPEGCHLTNKVLIAAAYSNVDVKVEIVSRDKKGYNVQGHPLKKVPVLETPAGSLFESNAIARFVAKQNGNPGKLFGNSAVEAAQVDSWITFAATEIDPPVSSWVWTANGTLPDNAALVKAASGDSRKLLATLDQVLKEKTFLVGERITLADIVVAGSLCCAFKSVFDQKLRKPFKNVVRWFTTVANQPQVFGVVGSVTLAGDKAPINEQGAAAPAADEKKEEEKKADAAEDDDDDFDVFGDDDDDEEREAEIQRIADAAAAAKAAKGKVVIAKSVVVLDVKPWDTETDLKALEEKIRGIEMEGLEWKGAELKPVAYGLKKICIM